MKDQTEEDAMDQKLELINLSKAYTPQVVPVKQMNLSVSQGEFLTLLGPSGCGKSTILRLIAGLEQPTGGQIMMNQRNITQLRPGDRNIAMVFQSYALYPHMTVYDNIASGLKLQSIASTEIKRRVNEVGDFLGLQILMNRKPGQLSGGQRQRVAVARALVRRPDVFLLDEPLSNLDALLREHVRAELKQLFEKQNAPVIYVTHDQTEAMTLSTKVAVLDNGFLQQLDTPERIYSQPANQFVAGFIGSPQMNFLKISSENNTALVGNIRISLPLAPTSSRSSQEIILGIRPEHLVLAKSEDQPTVRGQVFLIENLGMHNLVSVRVQNSLGETNILRVLLRTDEGISNGKTITLTLPTQLIHWFDGATGDRL
jgi:multiple sugar transport system ATP-binding protein